MLEIKDDVQLDDIQIHHSHINGEIIGYAHSYCNEKVRENKSKIRVITQNLFRFDFFSIERNKSWSLAN